MPKIIIVTGTPGVGKTVLAKLIVAKTRFEFLNLGNLIRQEKLYRQFDRSRSSYIIDPARLRRRLAGIFKSNTSGLVIETHWLGSFLPSRSGMAAVVVRTDPVLLAKRLKARGWSKKKIWENAEAELIDLSLYESVELLGKHRVYQIDATSKSPRDLMSAAWRFLSGEKRWDGWTPNWLDRYDPIDLRKRIF